MRHEHTWVAKGPSIGTCAGFGNSHEYSVRCDCGATGRQYAKDRFEGWDADGDVIERHEILRTEIRYEPPT